MNSKLRVVITSSEEIVPYGTTQMRCIQPKEYLEKRGFDVRLEELQNYTPRGEDVVILNRVIPSKHVFYLIMYARRLGSVVIYDTDDLIFHEDGARYLQRNGKKKHAKNSLTLQSLMTQCDGISVSTSPLLEYCKPICPRVYLNKNGLGYSFYNKAVTKKNTKKHSSQSIVIGYLSGSNTHNEDFRVVEPSLIKILSNFPNTIFLSVGPLEISDSLKKFGKRIEQKPFVPYSDYNSIFDLLDINLVPLEVDEAFCQSKSELKFIEAGICGVPSVASATLPHIEAIDNGLNGYLASNADEWYESIVSLIDAEHRIEMGINAKNTVIRNYSPELRSHEWESFINQLVTTVPFSASDKKLFLFIKFSVLRYRLRLYQYMKKLEKKARYRIKGK